MTTVERREARQTPLDTNRWLVLVLVLSLIHI